MKDLIIYDSHKKELRLSQDVTNKTVSTLTVLQDLSIAREAAPNPKALMNIIKHESKMTMASAIKEGTQISLLRKDNPELLEESITELLYLFRDNFNRANTLTDTQIMSLAIELPIEFWYLKLEEFILVFKNIKKGVYGKIHFLEPLFIHSCFTQYQDDSMNYRETNARTQNEQHKNPKFDPLTDKQMQKLASGLEQDGKRKIIKDSNNRGNKTDQERQERLNSKRQKRIKLEAWGKTYKSFTLEQLRTAYTIAKNNKEVDLMNWLKEKSYVFK